MHFQFLLSDSPAHDLISEHGNRFGLWVVAEALGLSSVSVQLAVSGLQQRRTVVPSAAQRSAGFALHPLVLGPVLCSGFGIIPEVQPGVCFLPNLPPHPRLQ